MYEKDIEKCNRKITKIENKIDEVAMFLNKYANMNEDDAKW